MLRGGGAAHRAIGVAISLGTALGVVACSAQPPVRMSPEASPPTVQPSETRTAGNGRFDVEVGGLSITGHCSGTRGDGDPAVLLSHGNGGAQGQLASIEEYVSEFALVCAYDRPGGSGQSDPPSERPRLVTDVATEARDVLLAAGVEPPYFLIGQSAGAAVSIVFAHLHAAEVAGFVASNPNPPFTAWIAAARKVESPAEIETLELPDYGGQNPEGIDMRGNDLMLEPIADSMPFAVLFDEDCGGDLEFCDRILESLADTQALIAETGAGGRFIWVEGAGHEIPATAPDEMRAAIEEIWAEATD